MTTYSLSCALFTDDASCDKSIFDRFPNAESVKLVVTLLIAYGYAVIYESFKNFMNAKCRHLFFSLCGLSLIMFNFGFEVLHQVVSVLTTYVLTVVLKEAPTTYLAVNFIFHMSYLMIAYYVTETEDYDITWTMPQCVMTLRMIGFGFDIVDGQKRPELRSEDQKLTALENVPSLPELFGFAFFPGSCMVGPQMSVKRYQGFISGEFSHYTGYWQCGLLRCALGMLYLVARCVGSSIYPDTYLTTAAYANAPFMERMVHLAIWGKVVLTKYIACWLISEGSLMCFGITYAGQMQNNKADWFGCSNVEVIRLETGTTGQHYIDTFNVNTNKWVAHYIYKRMKFLGNKHISHMGTLLFLALWHGWHTGYYIAFIYEYITITFEKQFNEILIETQVFQENNLIERVLIFTVCKLYNLILMGWGLLPFVLRTYDRWPAAMAASSYVGFIIMIWFALVIWICRMFPKL